MTEDPENNISTKKKCVLLRSGIAEMRYGSIFYFDVKRLTLNVQRFECTKIWNFTNTTDKQAELFRDYNFVIYTEVGKEKIEQAKSLTLTHKYWEDILYTLTIK